MKEVPPHIINLIQSGEVTGLLTKFPLECVWPVKYPLITLNWGKQARSFIAHHLAGQNNFRVLIKDQSVRN